MSQLSFVTVGATPSELQKVSNLGTRFGYLTIMPVNARDKQDRAGISRDKQGQGSDKQGKAGTSRDIPFLSLLVPTCLCLSMLVPACPCLSLSVPGCPCLSLYVSTFAIPSCLPLQMNITVFISMNIVTLTLLAKDTACKPCFKLQSKL